MRAKILIVEDESIVALNIKNRLEKLGYAVLATISSGEVAIQIAAEASPDLVLMDIKLKGKIDGIEAATQIRNQFQIPVVYLTAYADDETLNRAKMAEPYGYILKPFESRDLCTAIEIALHKHQIEKQLREREQWLATTIKSIGDAVITTDPQGLVTFMNPVAEELTRWKQDEVLGHELTQVFHAVHEITREAIQNPVEVAIREGVTVGLENPTVLIAKDGTEIPIDDSAAPIKNDVGKILGAVLVFHDVTEQQQFQALLQKANEALGIQVAESIDQLQQTNEQLRAEIAQRNRLENELRSALEKERELSELKSQILTTISHEYRTPLTTILSSAQLIEQYEARLTSDKKQKHFYRIYRAVEYLTKLVNDVLFVNQAEASTLEFHPASLDVEQLAREVLEEFQPQIADERTFILTRQGDLALALLDERLIKLMLRNLLSNAIKYSPQGSEIRVELVFEQNGVVFRVADKGIGIPLSDRDRLFKTFERGSNIGTAPGVGLGLAIVQECVDLHGGEVVVESELGVGTTFTVILPLTRP